MPWTRKHLLDIESLTPEEIVTVLDTARAFKAVGERASEMVGGLPRLSMVKHNVKVEPNHIYQLLQSFRLAAEREGVACDLTDGVKVSLPEGWAHVRASNTESMIR